MQDPADVPRRIPDFHYMIILLTEAQAAARTLFDLVPDQDGIEPLYRYLDDALRRVRGEIEKASG